MVREKKRIPPAYPLCVSGIGTLYSCVVIAPRQQASCVGLCAALVVAAFFSACIPISKSRKVFSAIARIGFFCMLGAVVGLTSWNTIASGRAPLATLADTCSISQVTAKLISDPVPYGSDFYKIVCELTSCGNGSDETWSAEGRCEALVPASLVRAGCPGRISSKRDSIFFAQGLVLTLDGTFAPYDPSRGERFFVSGAESDSARWEGFLSRQRAMLRLSLSRVLYDWGESGGFLFALLSGNRDYLSPTLEESFRRTGLTHILALSGTHLSLMALVATKIGRRAGGRRTAMSLSLVAILVFVWFAGLSPSLSRSLIMALAMMAMQSIGFAVPVVPLLAMTAFLHMAVSPVDALTLAFSLSYGALLGILTEGEALRAIAAKYVPDNCAAPLCASLGAQAFTAPILAMSVGTLAPIGIVASCLIEFPSSVYLVGGMGLACLSACFPSVSAPSGSLLGLLYGAISGIVGTFAAIDPLSIDGMPATIMVVSCSAAAYFSAILWTARCKKRRSPDASFARL